MATVLVVDDEAHVRQLLGQAIKRQGHEILEAESSDAALAVMENTPADVVFTDIQMPGQDGRWLTVQLRKRYPLTAVVLATSVRDLEASITLRFGVVSYLVKPFDLSAVANALNIALNWHREAATRGPEKVEEDQLEKWIDSLEIL
jgi:two-component system OmpR family response regulator